MIPAAIEIVGGVGIAEQAGEPQAEIPRVDRHHDIAFVVDHVLERRERVAPLTQHRVVDQALLTGEIAAVEGHAEVVAGRRLAIRGLTLHEQMRARTIGSRHASLLRSAGRNCSAGTMLLTNFAMLATALFTGAAVYISLVEHPARLLCPTAHAVEQWRPSYQRATVMQASLAVVGSLLAIAAWLVGAGLIWLLTGLVLGSVVPFTLP